MYKGAHKWTFVVVLFCSVPVPWRVTWPFPTVTVINSTAIGNARGIVTRHYNHPSDEYLDLFFRFHWETVIARFHLWSSFCVVILFIVQ